MIVRVAKVGDLQPGDKLEKECYGMRLLVVREPKGAYRVMDANCFHMGMPLVGGDIEDLGDHTCIVCPAHGYRIDLKTGCKVEKNLEGHVCGGKGQKQRLYNVHCDDEYVWVDIPAHPGKELASDVYNEGHTDIMMSQAQPATRGYGLFGTSAAAGDYPMGVPPGSPLQPYAGTKGWPAGSPIAMEEPMDLSQPSETEGRFSPERVVQRRRLDFVTMRPDESRMPASKSNARRKAATSAILKKSYVPPTAQPLNGNGVRQQTLFEAWGSSGQT